MSAPLHFGLCNECKNGPMLAEQFSPRIIGGKRVKLDARKAAGPASQGFAIRPAGPEDAGGILHCLGVAFEPYRVQYTAEAFVDTVMTTDALLHRLTEMIVLVAVDAQGNVVGTIGGAAVSSQEGHLRGMAVLPESHGSGIAQHLLNAMGKHLRGKGCKRISLDTTEPLQRAMRFYEKNGFRRTGKVSDFFGMNLIEYAKLF